MENVLSASATASELKSQWDEFSKEELHDKEDESHVSIAGRLMTKRGKGKSWFRTCPRFDWSDSNLRA